MTDQRMPHKYQAIASAKMPGRWIVRNTITGQTSAIRNTREGAEKMADKLNGIKAETSHD